MNVKVLQVLIGLWEIDWEGRHTGQVERKTEPLHSLDFQGMEYGCW